MASSIPATDNLAQVSLPLSFIDDENAIIKIAGDDREKYLQGQFTCDVIAQPELSWQFGSHCDAKGKVLSAFKLFKLSDCFYMLLPKSIVEKSIAELKKFAVFSKVTIEQTALKLVSFTTDSKDNWLIANERKPNNKQLSLSENSIFLFSFNNNFNQYGAITEPEKADLIFASLNLPKADSKLSILFDIVQGIAHLSNNSVGEYVPQMLNLQHLDAISFTKGCYIGQETVARMQYLGKNKRALFALVGQIDQVNQDDIIEMSIGDNWKRAGNILSKYQVDNNTYYIQSVMNNTVDENTTFRIKGKEISELSLLPLPYNLN